MALGQDSANLDFLMGLLMSAKHIKMYLLKLRRLSPGLILIDAFTATFYISFHHGALNSRREKQTVNVCIERFEYWDKSSGVNLDFYSHRLCLNYEQTADTTSNEAVHKTI